MGASRPGDAETPAPAYSPLERSDGTANNRADAARRHGSVPLSRLFRFMPPASRSSALSGGLRGA
jgi:hypothetical protein